MRSCDNLATLDLSYLGGSRRARLKSGADSRNLALNDNRYKSSTKSLFNVNKSHVSRLYHSVKARDRGDHRLNLKQRYCLHIPSSFL